VEVTADLRERAALLDVQVTKHVGRRSRRPRGSRWLDLRATHTQLAEALTDPPGRHVVHRGDLLIVESLMYVQLSQLGLREI
jgi:hypothetical protein